MVAPVAPPELAEVLDAAERPRAQGWSLRAAIVRYAQPEPQRASAVIELLRRAEFALHSHQKLLERDGERLWALVRSAPPADATGEVDGLVVGVLEALVELDRLGDELAEWAVTARGERPDGRVDTVVADVAQRLDALGVAREDGNRRPPPGRRRG